MRRGWMLDARGEAEVGEGKEGVLRRHRLFLTQPFSTLYHGVPRIVGTFW